MKLFRQCLVLCVLGFIVDLAQTVHIQACAERKIVMAVGSIIGIYVIGFWSSDWFVKSQSTLARLAMTLSGAFGAGVGTGLVIYFGG